VPQALLPALPPALSNLLQPLLRVLLLQAVLGIEGRIMNTDNLLFCYSLLNSCSGMSSGFTYQAELL
jgi:hypothetical protein